MLTAVVIAVVLAVVAVLVAVGLVGVVCSAVGAREDRVPPYAEITFVPEGVLLICSRCSTVSGPFPLSRELTAADMSCNCPRGPGGTPETMAPE